MRTETHYLANGSSIYSFSAQPDGRCVVTEHVQHRAGHWVRFSFETVRTDLARDWYRGFVSRGYTPSWKGGSPGFASWEADDVTKVQTA